MGLDKRELRVCITFKDEAFCLCTLTLIEVGQYPARADTII